ncbi:MAG: sulfite exporter TauE/SafE family protein [Sulfurimonas sp.]|uniref:sulfite exporter TauE/SafE family protein n=1 Tax=Sulfurimonas sp. TaxID=2022749 RepID=UPI00261AA7B6|nr:sulfite exporter TauE/SafE family protein [Sulfurimonas sp.]MDD2652629.1 sulfite exporter TauE/SafE family protein [Sulfurimonas sp.]MDD3450771.1 sulfite exporter TauE/SafE family protein [Sulfurimonas sp.]
MIELILLGVGVGILSGFFGIGGGTVLVPLLLLLGHQIKDAIGISIVQMVFSSIYGSYLNNKKNNLDVPLVFAIGIGGFCGAMFSGFIASSVDDRVLEIIFLSFAFFALVRLFFKTTAGRVQKSVHKGILFAIGVVLGTVSMLIGVGGSILLVPILVTFLHVDLKKAIAAGLFFVIFSSVAGLISHTLSREIDFFSGSVIGIASFAGVALGIHFKDKIDAGMQKKLLVTFYLLIVLYLAQRVFL